MLTKSTAAKPLTLLARYRNGS